MQITKEQLKQIIKEELEEMMGEPKEPKGMKFPSLPGSDPHVVDALNSVIEYSGAMAGNFPKVAQDLYTQGVDSNEIQNYYQLFWGIPGSDYLSHERFLHDIIAFMEGR